MTGTERQGARGTDDASTAVHREIVVIGASAGGVEALGKLVAGLPPELPAAVFVVLHVSPGGTSVLPQILARQTRLSVGTASDGEPVQRGRIYVAPPDHHMLLEHGVVRLSRGPRENGLRPAVDPLFRSAARAYGERVIGVILSGALDDGSDGMKMIADAGGAAVVQDPEEALYPSMPRAALIHDAPRVVPVAEMASALCAMLDEPIERESELVGNPGPPREPDRSDDDPRAGRLTSLTCPECGGTLWEHDEKGLLRYKCHVGHAYSPESLDVSQSQALEMALWAALRSLQERADMFRRLARRTRDGVRFEEKARSADEHAEVLRQLIMTFGREPGVEEAGGAEEVAG